MRAAKYLGVEPWRLAKEPAYWMDLALELEQSEFWAQRETAKRAAKQRRRGRR